MNGSLLIVNVSPPPPPLPPGWVVRESLSRPGYYYYFHQDTGECRWQLPIEPLANHGANTNDGASLAQQGTTTTTMNNSNDMDTLNYSNDAISSTSMTDGDTTVQQQQLSPRKGHHHPSPACNINNDEDEDISEGITTTTVASDRPKKRSRPSSGTIANSSTVVEEGTSSRKSPKEVRVLHILKKHQDSRRPSSWRHKGTITSTREQAVRDVGELLEILQEVQHDPAELRATFEELARTESDCSSAKRGGDLGFFGRKKMQPAFEHASFALDIGELSGIVDTSSGVHIILRIE
jgi:NIMA-interacting peptidyl-prolyl cis-trans isomerase 1